MKRIRARLFRMTAYTLSSVALLVSSASAALQTKTNLTITQVTFDGNRLILAFSGDSNLYYAFRSGAGGEFCSTESTDTIKVWVSMAQAGMLAGKKMEINYNTSSSTGCTIRTIESITVFQ